MKKRLEVDYSNDNIFQASKKLANIELKNSKSPVVPQPDINSPMGPVPTTVPSKIVSLQSDTTSSKAVYAKFLEALQALSLELDESLTDLDAQFQAVEMPVIDLSKKRNHNPEFEKYYKGVNAVAGEGLAGGVLSFDIVHNSGMTVPQLRAICMERGIAIQGDGRFKENLIPRKIILDIWIITLHAHHREHLRECEKLSNN